MNPNYPLLAILIGLVVRLILPVTITLVVIYFLRRLDEHWQKEAEYELSHPAQKAQSWDLKNCPIEKRASQPMMVSALPCWQLHRLRNGYLNDECLSCEIFRDAPARVAPARA